MNTPGRHHQRGQSITEFLVAMFGLGFLLLGIMQTILLYRAKTLVDYAAQEAARAGAVSGVDKSKMTTGFIRGMVPLYMTGSADRTGTLAAIARAKAGFLLGDGSIKVISPTPTAFNDWKELQFDGKQAIPNDSLYFRPSTVRNGLTVQDANILKIQVTYKYRLIVPVIDRVIGALLGTKDLVNTVAEGHDVYYIPIVAQATVRMQSPIYNADNLK